MSTDRTALSGGNHGDYKFDIHVAVAGDYEDVMRIDESVHKGMDYLPHTYHEALADPRTTSLIATVEHAVVVFACFWRLSAEMTLMIGGRMHPRHRSTGLYSAVVQHMRRLMKQRHPGLAYNWYVAIATDKQVQHATHIMAETLKATWTNAFGFVAPEDMRLASAHQPAALVSQLSLDQIQTVCRDKEIVKYTYPDGYILHPDRWMTYPTHRDSLLSAMSVGDVLLSGSLETGDLGISVTHSMRCSLGILLVISYHGTLQEEILKSHITKAGQLYSDVGGILKSSDVTASKTGNNFLAEEVVDRPMIGLNIAFPKGIHVGNINEFIKETFHANIQEDYYPSIGLYESKFDN